MRYYGFRELDPMTSNVPWVWVRARSQGRAICAFFEMIRLEDYEPPSELDVIVQQDEEPVLGEEDCLVEGG